MDVDFDPFKDAANITKHGVSLARAADFEFRAVAIDDRRDYGEARYRAFGFVDGEMYALAFTLPGGGILRAISLRRAHSKEFNRYVQAD